MEKDHLFGYYTESEYDEKMEYFFDQPLRELKIEKGLQLLNMGNGHEPKIAVFQSKEPILTPN